MNNGDLLRRQRKECGLLLLLWVDMVLWIADGVRTSEVATLRRSNELARSKVAFSLVFVVQLWILGLTRVLHTGRERVLDWSTAYGT